jgi:hypothetical protein
MQRTMIETKTSSIIFAPRHWFYFNRFPRTKSLTQFEPLVKVC